MASPFLLEGKVEIDNRDEQIRQLREANAGLSESLQAAKEELALAKRAVNKLKVSLRPQFDALRALFGELDAIGGDDAAVTSSESPKTAAVWEAWKKRVGGSASKVIDALLLHRELDTQQLVVATGLDRRTITNTCIYKLNQAGLINKNAGRFSLKQL